MVKYVENLAFYLTLHLRLSIFTIRKRSCKTTQAQGCVEGLKVSGLWWRILNLRGITMHVLGSLQISIKLRASFVPCYLVYHTRGERKLPSIEPANYFRRYSLRSCTINTKALNALKAKLAPQSQY